MHTGCGRSFGVLRSVTPILMKLKCARAGCDKEAVAGSNYCYSCNRTSQGVLRRKGEDGDVKRIVEQQAPPDTAGD